MLPESYYGWCGGSDSCGDSQDRVAITLDRWEETVHEILTKGCHQNPVSMFAQACFWRHLKMDRDSSGNWVITIVGTFERTVFNLTAFSCYKEH